MAQSGEQGREEEEVAEILGISAWNASTTQMLISFYKENPILWDKQLKEHGNKTMSLAIYCPPIVCSSQVCKHESMLPVFTACDWLNLSVSCWRVLPSCSYDKKTSFLQHSLLQHAA